MDNKIIFLNIVIFSTFLTLIVSNTLFNGGFSFIILLILLLIYILPYVFFYRCGNFQKLLFILSICFLVFSLSTYTYFNDYNPFLMILNWYGIWLIFRWKTSFDGEIDSRYLTVSVIFIFYLVFNLILLFSPGNIGILEINTSILILGLSIISSIIFMIKMITDRYSSLSYNKNTEIEFKSFNINEKLKKFFTPLLFIALMALIFFVFTEKDFNALESYYAVGLLVFYSNIIILLIYIFYPLVNFLFKKEGLLIQKIIILLVLIFISLAMFFSFIGIPQTFLWILYLAIFINVSSNIEKKDGRYYILSYPIKKNTTKFDEIVNSSSFNVLMSVMFLTIVVAESLYYFDPYFILTSISAIVLVISSVVYGKRNSNFNYSLYLKGGKYG